MRAIRDMAAATPSTRNRAIDAYRVVAIIVVVLGHWLAAAVWVEPGGRLRFNTVLALADWTHLITWVVQVMPIFFIVGGFANWKSYARRVASGGAAWDWAAGRFRRLATPVTPLIVVITGLVVATLAAGVDTRIVRSGSWNALVPLWFLAVYMIVIAAVPATAALWERMRWASVLIGVGLAVLVDVARFTTGVEWLGWANFVFVWIAVHQVGYAWATEEHRPDTSTLVGLVVAAPLVLILVTRLGLYPTSMVAVPGAPANNTLPPTAVMLLIGAFQYGLMRLLEPATMRLMHRKQIWVAVVAVGSVMMTIYIWHLTALVLVVLAGYAAGLGFGIEPLSGAWYATRPLWVVVLGLVLAGLVLVFGRFERLVRTPTTLRRGAVSLGFVAFIAAIAVFVTETIVDVEGGVRWWTLVVYAAGVAGLGAWPPVEAYRSDRGGVRSGA